MKQLILGLVTLLPLACFAASTDTLSRNVTSHVITLYEESSKEVKTFALTNSSCMTLQITPAKEAVRADGGHFTFWKNGMHVDSILRPIFKSGMGGYYVLIPKDDDSMELVEKHVLNKTSRLETDKESWHTIGRTPVFTMKNEEVLALFRSPGK